MRPGAKEGVGFDISDAAISEAWELAGIAKEMILSIFHTDPYNGFRI